MVLFLGGINPIFLFNLDWNQGFAIGNGLTNPEIQYGAYGDYALQMKLISESDHESLKQDYVECQNITKKCSNFNKKLFLLYFR